MSTDEAGTKAISSSIEGTVYLSDLARGKAVAKKATYKDQTEDGVGEYCLRNVILQLMCFRDVVLPAWAVAMHPDGRSWACTGQSAKVGFYSDLTDISETLDVDLENAPMENQDDEDQDDKTSQSLGKLVKVIETGRGKFGMDLKYVSSTLCSEPCSDLS